MDVAPGIACVRDTCNVYVLRSGREAVLVDFGSGAVLDRLGELGVDRVTDVLVTHHHRDQVQGLARAAAAGIRIWVPPLERALVDDVDRHWQARQVVADYELLQDRFSLLEQVPVSGTVDEYRTRRYGGFDVTTLPTPGHTIGSVSYLVESGGRRLAFSGDLLHEGGRVWSLAATQWTYSGVEGLAGTIVSCAILGECEPDLLLPSHGEPIDDPPAAIAALSARLEELMNLRRETPWDLDEWRRRPWKPVTPHLLRNRTSFANSYALVSESGAALLVDWGYDLWTGGALSTDRFARRPLLASLEALRRDHGVERIEAVVTTHYHDDHVAGINLLRAVEGAEVWSPENVAPILEQPERQDLPCLWFEPVPVDRRLAAGEPVRWHEYELTAYPLPGHTLYAAAIAFEVDGRRVLATGDQQGMLGEPAAERDVLNYQYRNRYRVGDFVRSAELYLELGPEIMISGHWFPREVTDGYLERLLADARRTAELHRELLAGFGPEGFGARIEPYRASVAAGGSLELEVTLRNPFDRTEVARASLVVPAGWRAEPAARELELPPRGEGAVRFRVEPGGVGGVRRARVAAELAVGETPFGQQAEALVDVE